MEHGAFKHVRQVQVTIAVLVPYKTRHMRVKPAYDLGGNSRSFIVTPPGTQLHKGKMKACERTRGETRHILFVMLLIIDARREPDPTPCVVIYRVPLCHAQ